jgi:hypothetical protein
MDADPFSPGQEALSKSPADPHGLAGPMAWQAPSGDAFLFGYFLLGKQEKVTRRSANRRKPAAGEHAGENLSPEQTRQIET